MSLHPTNKPKESVGDIEELTAVPTDRMRKKLYRMELIRPAGCTGDTPEEIAVAECLELSRNATGVRFTVIQRDGIELPEVRIVQDNAVDGEPPQI